jgi:hypothetical protein
LGLPRRQLLHENPQRGRQGVFERATKFDYLDKNPLDKLDPITVVEVPTLPVTPEEFTLLLASVACLKEKYHRTMTALILLMRWSGLSIMDAACLRRDALRADNRLRTYRKKTGEYVLYQAAAVRSRLAAGTWQHARHLFLLEPDTAQRQVASYSGGAPTGEHLRRGEGHASWRTPITRYLCRGISELRQRCRGLSHVARTLQQQHHEETLHAGGQEPSN